MLFGKSKKIKPRILITHSDHQSLIQLFFIGLAVRLAGGYPAFVSPNKNTNPISFDALILYGGVDVSPKLYGKALKVNYHYDNNRDEMEIHYLGVASKKNMPILGVCRGAQLMNVYHGGTLHADVTKAFEKAKYPSSLLGYIFFRKKIKINAGSLLRKIIKRKIVKVNSIHRQSIDKVGDGLMATSFEYNGIIQSIENTYKNFYMGVQFHPEFLIYKSRFREIFNVFVESVKKYNFMPYNNILELPDSVKDNLPKHACEIYLAAYNNAWDQYKNSSDRDGDDSREEVSHKVAWSAVKNKYEKNDSGDWVEK